MWLIDVEALQNPNYKNRGIGRYIRNFLTALRQCGVKFKVVFNPRLAPPDINRAWLEYGMIPATRTSMKNNPADWLIILSPIEESLGDTHIIYRSVNKKGKVATLIHDLIPILYEETYLRNKIDRTKYDICTSVYMQSDLLLTVSYNTKLDVERIISPKCPVAAIGAGVDEFFYTKKNHEDNSFFRNNALNRGNLSPLRYIFTVSGLHKSKNLLFLLEAYSMLDYNFRSMYPLVVAGGFSSEAKREIHGIWDRKFSECTAERTEIYIEDHLSDELIKDYYHNAALFVYPSLYEGFGLPLAEAIVCDAPSIAAHRSAMREVLPFEAAHFDPRDVNSLKEKIRATVNDRAYRNQFLGWAASEKDRFRWSHVASTFIKTIDQFRDVEYAETKNEHKRSKVAIIGPLKPSRTGIALYNSIMMEHLSSTFEWFATEGFSNFPLGTKPYPAVLINKSWMKYDGIVYVIGNSFHHVFALDTLMKRPGIVWLHDIRLNGLAWDFANKCSPTNPFDVINSWIDEYKVGYKRINSLSEVLDAPFSFARPLLKMARSFIVHSEHARAMLIEDLGEYSHLVSIDVVPLAIASYPHMHESNRSIDNNIIIGIVGFIAPIKQPELIIRASGLLARSGYTVTISLLGHVDERYAVDLKILADKEGVIIVTHGYLDDEEFREQLEKMDVVILVRSTTNGESSATAGEVISYGIPLISNIPSVVESYGDYAICVSPMINHFELFEEIKTIVGLRNVVDLKEKAAAILKRNSFSSVSKIIEHTIEKRISNIY